MDYIPPKDFRFPSTRYSGSKRRLLSWIWQNIRNLQFETVLDVFGGTASVSLLFKYHGKKVHFNDILRSNQLIGIALIQNNSQKVTEKELSTILCNSEDKPHPGLIEREFRGIYFTEEENRWLDTVVTRILKVEPEEKRAILMVCLFQSCLSKRPYNLFHRANLYMRLADVSRTFGNKATWEIPFPTLMKRFLQEYNAAIFSNYQNNRVVGGFDALNAPNGVDLVYLDPPYYGSGGTSYLDYYHFLEGLADYSNWESRIDLGRKTKGFRDIPTIDDFAHKDKIYGSFEQLFERFKHNKIVLSYRDDGKPTENEIVEMLHGIRKQVTVHRRPHRYALSPDQRYELLFIAE